MLRCIRTIPHALLILALVLLTGQTSQGRADKEEIKVATEAVNKLIAGGKLEDVAPLAKKTSLEALMSLYLPEKKGGLGVGAKGEGIEMRLQNLSKKAPSPAELAKDMDALIKAMQHTRAITDFNDLYTPKAAMGKKNPIAWKKYNDEVKKHADELIEAIKKGDTKKVQAAAKSVEVGCNECHSLFR